MSIDRRFLIAAVAPLALLAACKQAPLEMGKPATFGEASKQTFNAQVVDPAPSYDDPLPAGSGDKAAAAIDRYRKDQVKQPDKTRTSSSTTGSGSAGN